MIKAKIHYDAYCGETEKREFKSWSEMIKFMQKRYCCWVIEFVGKNKVELVEYNNYIE